MTRIFFYAFVLVLFAGAINAQDQSSGMPAQTAISVHDASVLVPPPGAKVAIVEFSDLECPACARENPLLMKAVAQYKIPWVRRDFPLRQHPWSFQAAVYARWFDTKSKQFGDQYRDAVFANQRNIETLDDLRAATDKFAKDRGLAMPFAVDPQNQLADLVRADQALGNRVGIQETPTLFVVTSSSYAQVTDYSQLFSMLDHALAVTGAAGPKPPAKSKSADK
jgi:protein-disulfide isomerase